MLGGGPKHQLLYADTFKVDLNEVIPAHGSHFDDHTGAESLMTHVVAQRKSRDGRGGGCFPWGRGRDLVLPGSRRLIGKAQIMRPLTKAIALGNVFLDMLVRNLIDKAGDFVGSGAAKEHSLAGADQV